MGGAISALPGDSSTAYYNPAGLAALKNPRLDIGYHYVSPKLTINDGDQGVSRSQGLQAGLVLPFDLINRTLSLGIVLHLPDERVSRIRALPEVQPRWVVWDNRPQRILIGSAAGFEVLPGLFIGAGLTYLANTQARVEMNGFVHLNEADETFLDSAVDADLKSVRYWNAGILYHPTPTWAISATWRQSFNLFLDLGVDVSGDIGLDQADPLFTDSSFRLRSTNSNLYSPQQAYLGISYTGGDWLIGLEIGWIQWSKFPAPTATVDVQLDIPDLPFDVPTPAAPQVPNFEDIWIPRVGFEWSAYESQLFGLKLRGGYFYESSPTAPQTGTTNYVDGDKHGFSWGVGFQMQDRGGVLPHPLEIGLSLQTIILGETLHAKTDPADPIGDYVSKGYSIGGFASVGLVFE